MMLKNITPVQFACPPSMACPAIFTNDENGNIVIVGRQVMAGDHPELSGLISGGEAAIEISAKLFDAFIRQCKEERIE